jgi:TPR repeat protein
MHKIPALLARLPRPCTAVLVVLLLCAAPVAAQTHEAAIRAYNRGAYDEARATWLALAKTRDPTARYSLGRLYELGTGVKQDFEKAAYWYRLAAEQNHPYAQGSLAVLYAYGRGVEQDFVRSYVLSSRAADNYSKWAAPQREAALKNRDIVAARMTPEEVAEAQRQLAKP